MRHLISSSFSSRTWTRAAVRWAVVAAFWIGPCGLAWSDAAEPATQAVPAAPARQPDAQTLAEAEQFKTQVQPLLAKFCVRCHNVDERKSGVRVDHLTGIPEDQHYAILKGVRSQLADGAMPPDDEPQPSAAERKSAVDWIERALVAAKKRERDRNGSVRRLTVAQYRNTLRDLLGLAEDLTDSLPPDAVSKDGFVNHDKTLALSPLQVETYFDIASQALDLSIVDENAKPVIQTFRMELGEAINANPCPDNLILGANSALLANRDFVVTEPVPEKPFAFEPFRMRTKFDFIEGYAGNDTVRGWRKYDSIYHAVFACVRGTPGYPKGEPNQVLKEGLALRPAIPSPEVFGRSNTYGPMANFKISLRELPERGEFRVTVKAARYDDGLLLDSGTAPLTPGSDTTSLEWSDGRAAANEVKVGLPAAGIYQVDVGVAAGTPAGRLSLQLGERSFAGQLFEPKPAAAAAADAKPADAKTAYVSVPFLVLRLPAGPLAVTARYGDNARLRRMNFTRLADTHDLAKRFVTFERRLPSLGVHVGLRRDCGSTLTRVGEPTAVASRELRDYVFTGAINDFPSPDVERDNVNYLAGVREIGVRSEYTDGRDMPRLLVRSIEFEGPYYTQWPPTSHRAIFLDSPVKSDPPQYAREILKSFATRAFRRPVTDMELASLVAVWEASFAEKRDFRQSVKDALLVVLTSPQFLFIIETSQGPQAEDLDSFELASKLSYFLWNTAPDRRLLELAEKNQLRESLDAEIDRLVHDPRFGQFVSEFAGQWLSLDKFDVVAVDGDRFPRLTRDAKTELRQEPVRFVRHSLENNLSLRTLLRSDFILANEVVANYYGLADRVESGFEFVAVKHDDENLGGLLSQASILAGLSDGREPNPVKRGAWLARKIIAQPPEDPPPNVPRIKEDDASKLTLREKLERHRNQEGCAKCHAGIDPWGLPFERFDAAGLFRKNTPVDARSKLPDGPEVADLNGLKAYLADGKIDQVAFSFLKHMACYATGRSLSYNELVFLQEEAVKFRPQEYRTLDMIRFVVKSDLFLKK